jgi:hypothetical protein
LEFTIAGMGKNQENHVSDNQKIIQIPIKNHHSDKKNTL